MRSVVWFAAIVLAIFGVYHLNHRTPSAQQVEPLLHTYLERSYRVTSCRGQAEIAQLDSVRVGAYVNRFDGWPVYADHVEKCVVHGWYGSSMRTTYDHSHDADRNVAIAFVRRNWFGHLAVYAPQFFPGAQRRMQQMVQRAVDNTKTN